VRLDARIESLPVGAFAGCLALEAIRIPGSVRFLGRTEVVDSSSYYLGSRGCISSCRNLRSVDFAASDILEFLGDGCFEWCTALEALHLPTSVRVIGRRFAAGCSSLTDLRVGPNLQQVGDRFLANCSALSSFVMPPLIGTDLGTAGEHMLQGCGSLTRVDLGEQMTHLPHFLLADCVALKTIELPSSVREIKHGFAANCTALQEIVLCQDSCLEFLQVGFATGCTALRQFVIPSSVKELRGRQTSSTRTAYSSPYYSPTPADGFLDGCESLVSIDIPDSVTTIAVRQGFLRNCNSLMSVRIGTGLTHLPDAFVGCTSLRELTLPDTLVSLGCTGVDVNVKVPTTLGFARGCTSLKSIHLGRYVTHIGRGFAAGCPGIESVALPDTLLTVGDHFFASSGLRSIQLPEQLQSIGEHAFAGCLHLTELTVPDSTTDVGSSFLAGCRALRTVHFGSRVKCLESRTCGDCISLVRVHVPANVTSIKSEVFSGCTRLRTIDGCEGVAEYGDVFAADCSMLEAAPFQSRRWISAALASVPLPATSATGAQASRKSA
jgi:hypothetical protein